MRRLLAGIFACAAALAAGVITPPSVSDVAPSDTSRVSDAAAPLLSSDVIPADGSAVSDTSAPSPFAPSPVPACGSEQDAPSGDDPACTAATTTPDEIAQARAYLVETASPGYTMTLQGPEVAIGRLHPEFAVRLEHAIREARSTGLPFASIFSAYRPPAFGVGGFSDKFNSLHTYGLAVDMRGIGAPGSSEAQLWHEIAAKNGAVCPYGPRDRVEWNHCQPTSNKMVTRDNPLRETVSSAGPLDLESMFEVGNVMIEDMASAAQSLSKTAPTPVRALDAAARDVEPTVLASARQRTKRSARVATRRVAEKLGRQAKIERAGGKPTQHAKLEHVDAKSARDAKRERHAQAARVEDGRRKAKSKG
jgi:hypothetical protein